jgi:hypothetical protein
VTGAALPDLEVPLEWTACNFGGERPWFICPGAGCSRRVAVLHAAGKHFLCRHCYDLRAIGANARTVCTGPCAEPRRSGSGSAAART